MLSHNLIKRIGMKKYFYALAFSLIASSHVAAFESHMCFDETNNESKWTYLEKTFITDISDAKSNVWKHLNNLIPATAITAALWKYNKLQKTPAPTTESSTDAITVTQIAYNAFSAENVCLGVTLTSSVVLATQGLQCYLNYSLNRQAVESYLKNWEVNKLYTPDELVEFFEFLVERIHIQGKESVLSQAHEIVETLQFLTVRHFEKRYAKALDIVAANAFGDIKTATEIIKNGLDITGKLTGSK